MLPVGIQFRTIHAFEARFVTEVSDRRHIWSVSRKITLLGKGQDVFELEERSCVAARRTRLEFYFICGGCIRLQALYKERRPYTAPHLSRRHFGGSIAAMKRVHAWFAACNLAPCEAVHETGYGRVMWETGVDA